MSRLLEFPSCGLTDAQQRALLHELDIKFNGANFSTEVLCYLVETVIARVMEATVTSFNARKLPPVDETARCRKCNCDDVRMAYCKDEKKKCYRQLGEDHIHRRCYRCCYVWFERCIDNAAIDAATLLTEEK